MVEAFGKIAGPFDVNDGGDDGGDGDSGDGGADGAAADTAAADVADATAACSTAVTVSVSSLQLTLVDDVRSEHLALCKVGIAALALHFEHDPANGRHAHAHGGGSMGSGMGGDMGSGMGMGGVVGTAKDAMSAALEAKIWADYFNVRLRCWEPLLEPWRFRVLAEQHDTRGLGCSVKAPTTLQANITGELLDSLPVLMDSVSASMKNVEQANEKAKAKAAQQQQQSSLEQRGKGVQGRRRSCSGGSGGSGSGSGGSGGSSCVGTVHGSPSLVSAFASSSLPSSSPPSLSGGGASSSFLSTTGKVQGAFSISNDTGGPLRYFQHSLLDERDDDDDDGSGGATRAAGTGTNRVVPACKDHDMKTTGGGRGGGDVKVVQAGCSGSLLFPSSLSMLFAGGWVCVSGWVGACVYVWFCVLFRFYYLCVILPLPITFLAIATRAFFFLSPHLRCLHCLCCLR